MTRQKINYKKSIPPQRKGNGIPKSQPDIKEGTQSILRAILLLRAVATANEQGFRLYQIADAVGLPITTAHRILNVLVSEGLLEYDPALKSYHIGIGLYSLGNKATRFALRSKYRSCLENIAHKTKDSAYLIVKSGLDALCIDSIESESTIRIMTYTIGSREPLGIGAGSLALLAFSSDDDVKSVIEANRLRYKSNNDTSVTKLKNQINKARKLGYVFNKGIYMRGINAVGLPLFDETGEIIAATSVASIAERIDIERSKEIAALIKSEISLID
jgi:DNA-binding IclR family transcriptional regulator